MKYLIILGLILAFIFPAAVSAQPPQPVPYYNNQDSPVALLASYYNAIQHQEYQRAYAYWQSPPNTYSQFINGFADTLSVQLIVEPPVQAGVAAGSLYVEIPTLVLAGHRDGSQHMYYGCFVTRKSNLQPPDIPQPDVWHLYSAHLVEVPLTSSIPALLAQTCTI